MPQVKKPEVDERIRAAALRHFAEDGYPGTSMAAIARTAGMATANLYRYHPQGKQQLFDAVIPPALVTRFERLLTDRVEALVLGNDPGGRPDPQAEALLDFWIAHRLEVVVMLDRAAGTPVEDVPARFVERLLTLSLQRLHEQGVEPDALQRQLLELVFVNTRTAIAQLLRTHDTRADIRRAVEGFWSYQLPGLAGLAHWCASLDDAPTEIEAETDA